MSKKPPKLLIVSTQFTACILVPDGEKPEDAIRLAKESIIATIQSGGLPPSDTITLEPKHERDLPFDWKTQEPFVEASITDEEFAAYAQTGDGENLNVLEVFKSLKEK